MGKSRTANFELHSDRVLESLRQLGEKETSISGWRTKPVKCNFCGLDHSSGLWVKDGFSYVKCSNCGLVYINPQLLPSEVERIYAIGYESKSASKPDPIDFLTYQPLLRWAARYNRTGRLLDVGCFKGYLLVAARSKGWEVFGTEISAGAVEYARQKQSLNIFLGSLPEAGYPEGYFDVVIMQDVIEHLSDPSGYLREIFRILRPGGGLYIDTPNFSSIARYILGKDWSVFFPWHQYYFTARTLRKMLEKAGFKVQNIRCTGLGPISSFNPFFSLQVRQEIVRSSRHSMKSFFRHRAPFLRRPYFFFRSIANIPFFVLSTFNIHIGSKMIALAESRDR